MPDDTANNFNLPALICGTLILIVILVGIFVLAWHRTFTGVEVLGIVTTIVGIAGGAFAVHSGVAAAGKAAARQTAAQQGKE